MKLIIRDGFAQLNRDKTTYEMPSNGLDVLSEDGRTLFSINLTKLGSITVSGGDCCNVNGVLLNTGIEIFPVASNMVEIKKTKY